MLVVLPMKLAQRKVRQKICLKCFNSVMLRHCSFDERGKKKSKIDVSHLNFRERYGMETKRGVACCY